MSRTASPLAPVVRLLHKIAADPDDTDARLLERFTQVRDEAAFEALLRRHGPMVLGVCRRVLDDADLADDAFQATFLVLAKKAASIRKRPSVGSWLFGVAFRTSLKARARAARRRFHERAIMPPATTEPSEEFVWRELRPLLDAELDRLPEKYRAPLVLCYLEGKTNEEAARQLGWTKGTVSGRLARARDVLRQRLVRRGLDLTAGALLAALAQGTATAAVPENLFRTTLLNAAGHTAAAGAVASLSEGVIQMMTLGKIRTTALVLLVAVGLGGAGAGWAYQAGGQEGAAGDKKQPPPTVVRPNDLRGTWQVVEIKATKDQPPKEVKMYWSFSKDALTIRTDELTVEARYKTDPTRKPAPLDLTIVKGPENERNKSYKAIYSLQGDELQVCLADGAADRPQEFKAADRAILFTLKRADQVKLGKAPPPLRPPTKQNQEAEMQRAMAMRAEAEALVRVSQARLKQAQAELDRAEAQLRITEAQLRRLKEDAAPDAAARRQSRDNLKKIGLALHNYHYDRLTLPAPAVYGKDGKALLSWRVAILPYLDQQELYRQFKLDEPWDSPHNKQLLDRIPDVFKSPAGKGQVMNTPYQVMTGPTTAFPGDKGLRLTQIADGTSYTILVAEAAHTVPWTKPEDVRFGEKEQPKLGGVVQDGVNVLMADGAVRFFPRDTDPEVLRAAVTRNGGENFTWDKEGRPVLKR